MMKKSILILLLSIISVTQINAQADCFFKYCYIGNVSLGTKTAKGNNIFVQLPSPELMLNIVDQAKGFIKAKVNDQLKYEKESVTIGSSIFCGDPDNIIEQILKGSKSVYTIYIIKGKRKYKKDIKIENIAFSHKDGTIYITLPQIII